MLIVQSSSRLNVVHTGHFVFLGELAKLYKNVVICLQLDIVLLVHNLVKI